MAGIYFADVDECSEGSNRCSRNAACLNTEGSYECRCASGYTGSGTVCEGTHMSPTLMQTLWPFSCSVLPNVAGPEGQSNGGSGPSTGLLAGVAVSGVLVVTVVLVVGVLCALKIRVRSKSVNLPTIGPIGFGKHGIHSEWWQF